MHIEMDPLLKDLSDKNHRLRRNAVSMAMELKNTQGKLVSIEQSVAREEERRLEAECRALKLENDLCRLQKNMDERVWQFCSSHKCLKKLEEYKHMGCKDRENQSLSSSKSRHLYFPYQWELLDGICRSYSKEHKEQQWQPGEGPQTVCLSPESCRNGVEKVETKLEVRDEEMAALIDDITTIFDHFEQRTVELESQVRGNQRVERGLKKRMVRLEFCLQETRSHARRLHRMVEKRERVMRNQKHERKGRGSHGFWQSSGFKVAVSMSMVILVALSRS